MGVPQRQLGVKIDLQQQKILLDGLGREEVRERARLGSLTLPHAEDWLNTAPLTALDLHLRQAEFVFMAKYRLGMNMYDRDGPCPACLRPSAVTGWVTMPCPVALEESR